MLNMIISNTILFDFIVNSFLCKALSSNSFFFNQKDYFMYKEEYVNKTFPPFSYVFLN